MASFSSGDGLLWRASRPATASFGSTAMAPRCRALTLFPHLELQGAWMAMATGCVDGDSNSSMMTVDPT
jgi:hypothetical protein